jgi:energy-coupling factor transporter ATP-binding protein EcfA2
VSKLSTTIEAEKPVFHVMDNKLVAIEVENFMSIGQTRIEFDETGIINLCGYNDSGKSAITRALEVILYDGYSSDQVNFIMDDQDHFGIGLEFADGVSINKFKYANGKSVWEMMRNGEMLFTNRLANGVAAMSDIPEVIANYLGVVKDEHTDEQLNVRRNTDKLFLINTTGGDNYKIINSVLRCDVLAESVKRMNEDRNKLQSEVSNLATSSATLKNELTVITVVDTNTLGTIEQGMKNLSVNKQRSEYLTAIGAQKEILDSFAVYDEVPMIDTDRLTSLMALQELKKSLEVPIYTECSVLDSSRLTALSEIIQLRQALDVSIPPEAPIIDVSRFNDVMTVGKAFNDLWNSTNSLNVTTAEHESVVVELTSLSTQYGFKICKACGTVAV